jgi:FkbM family methyltransferase
MSLNDLNLEELSWEELEILTEVGSLVLNYSNDAFLKLTQEASQKRQSPLLKVLAQNCRNFIRAYENHNYNSQTNGELFVIQTLNQFWAQESEVFLFDVGANRGNWSLMVNQIVKNATVHCFEIAPVVIDKLKQNTQHISSIIINSCGLSDQQGELKIRYFPDADSRTTITGYPVNAECIETTGNVLKGDDYLAENNLNHIHFLKIDVEGAEHLVLKGFLEALAQQKIDIIQFEYGQVNILTHFLLIDFYALLSKYGYKIGKIYPNYVEFKDYGFEDENFLGPNYLAIKKDQQKMINSLFNN